MSVLQLASGSSRATVALAGAELKAWSVGGVPLIWQPDPAIWAGSAPILFPVVGWTRDGIRVDGKRFALGLHGFAATLPFRIAEQSTDRCSLVAVDDARTRGVYPFAFSLAVDYEIDDASLCVTLRVGNAGSRAMPYACGLHPGFRWPLDGDKVDHFVLFDEHEDPHVPVIASDGLFTRQRRRVPLDGCRLPLSEELMAQEALCFMDCRSRGLRFVHQGSGAAIAMRLQDFPHVALWSRPGASFLCIEAWTGHGDMVDSDGDLFTKPSMRHLQPGAEACHRAQFCFAGPHLF